MYSIEKKIEEFLNEMIPYLDISDLRDLLDYLDFDDIVEYVEYSDKYRVMSIDEYDEYEYLKSETKSSTIEDEAPYINHLKEVNSYLELILRYTSDLGTFLNNTSKELKTKLEENQTIINESNSNK